jgi:predicted nucleotide-binding protein
MEAVDKVLGGIDELRNELTEIRLKSPGSLLDVKLKVWTTRAFEQLKSWGFEAEAEEGFGSNSSTSLYPANERAQLREDRLTALRDDVASHPDHYASKLAARTPLEPASSKRASTKVYKVFLGHGRNKLWARVHMFLKDDLHLEVEAWETNARAGMHSIDVLKQALRSSIFAVIVVTGEDPTADGGVRARQNVVHEIGLFQGALGFQKVALLQQDGVEEFSNLSGLQVIQFSSERIESSFYELQRMLKREEIVK